MTAAEGGTGYDHAVTMARSRDLFGPYELHPDTFLLTSKDAPDAPAAARRPRPDRRDPGRPRPTTPTSARRPLPGLRRSPLGRETAIQLCAWGDDGWLRLAHGGLVPAVDVPAPPGAPEPEPDRPVEYRFDGPALPEDFQWLRTPYPERIFTLTGDALRLHGREVDRQLVRAGAGRPPPAALPLPRRDPPHRLRPRHLPAGRRPHDLLQPLQVPLPRRQPRRRPRPRPDHPLLPRRLARRPPHLPAPPADPAPRRPGRPRRRGHATPPSSSSSAPAANGCPPAPTLDASVISDEGGRGEHGSFTGAFVGLARLRHLRPRLPGRLRLLQLPPAVASFAGSPPPPRPRADRRAGLPLPARPRPARRGRSTASSPDDAGREARPAHHGSAPTTPSPAPPVVEDIDADVRAGRVGSLFNLWGRDAVRAAQRIAVEETRLGIPLFFALDVIHGFRTVFPIPLAEAGAFDPALWEETARIAAEEAAAAGLDLTFAPMLDVARDPRWGRIAEGPGEDPSSAPASPRPRSAASRARPRRPRRHPQALRRLRRQRRRPRLRRRRHLRPRARRDLPAAVPRRGRGRRARGHARLHRPRRRAADREPRAPHRHPARAMGLRGRRHQRLRRRRRAHPPRRRRRHRRGRRPRAQRRRRHRHDVPRLPRGPARGARPRPRRPWPRSTPPSPASSRSRPASASSTTPTAAAPAPIRRPRRRTAPAARARPPPAARAPAEPRRRPAAARRPRAGSRSSARSPTPPARCSAPGPPPAAATRRSGVLAGLRAALPERPSTTSRASPIEGGDAAGIAAAVAAAARADHVILCLGEAAWMSGEAASRARIDLPGRQAELAAAVLAAGKPVVVLLFSGRPIAMPEVFAGAAAVARLLVPRQRGRPRGRRLLTGAPTPPAAPPGHLAPPRRPGPHRLCRALRRPPENPADKYTSKYLDLPNSPQFPFGHGLATPRFALADPVADPPPGGVTVTRRSATPAPARRRRPSFCSSATRSPRVARPTLDSGASRGSSSRPARPSRSASSRPSRFAPSTPPAPGRGTRGSRFHVGLSADPAALRTPPHPRVRPDRPRRRPLHTPPAVQITGNVRGRTMRRLHLDANPVDQLAGCVEDAAGRLRRHVNDEAALAVPACDARITSRFGAVPRRRATCRAPDPGPGRIRRPTASGGDGPAPPRRLRGRPRAPAGCRSRTGPCAACGAATTGVESGSQVEGSSVVKPDIGSPICRVLQSWHTGNSYAAPRSSALIAARRHRRRRRPAAPLPDTGVELALALASRRRPKSRRGRAAAGLRAGASRSPLIPARA